MREGMVVALCAHTRRSFRPVSSEARAAMYNAMRVWPGYNRSPAKSNFLPGFGPITITPEDAEANANADFAVTAEQIEADALIVANMWKRAPANKMTLSAVQDGVDANNDGLIDADEFKALLAAGGYKGGGAAGIFAAIDADGDGVLTEAEIKKLSQGSATLQSGKVR